MTISRIIIQFQIKDDYQDGLCVLQKSDISLSNFLNEIEGIYKTKDFQKFFSISFIMNEVSKDGYRLVYKMKENDLNFLSTIFCNCSSCKIMVNNFELILLD